LLDVSAQLPAYYNGISTISVGQPLKDQLSNLITSTHTVFLTYTPGIWDLLSQADLDLNDPSKVQLIYGYNDSDGTSSNDRTRSVSLMQTGSSNVGVWNREHVYAKSLGTPDLGTTGPGADGHHLRAADGEMNNTRGSFPFTSGTGNAHIVGGIKFYPGDEWKGDVARMMMYMYLRYPSQCIPTNVGDPLITFSGFDQMIDLFITWSEQDAVCDFERQRNEAIYQAQGNRNPFIDEPYFATRIWKLTTPLGIEEKEPVNPFFVYPNPFDETIHIYSYTTAEWEFSITDEYGRELLHGEEVDQINLEELNKGLYFLTFSTEQYTHTERIICR
jgi:endonuclease I